MIPTQKFAVGGNLSTMACGLPFVIAAQFAYPNRQCVAFVGDGGFTMLMGEFATAAKYKLPIKVVVLKNNHYSRIISEDQALGIPPFGTELQPIDFVRFAEACGGIGFACARPEEGDCWQSEGQLPSCRTLPAQELQKPLPDRA